MGVTMSGLACLRVRVHVRCGVEVHTTDWQAASLPVCPKDSEQTWEPLKARKWLGQVVY